MTSGTLPVRIGSESFRLVNAARVGGLQITRAYSGLHEAAGQPAICSISKRRTWWVL
jgi:hypothetical protein